MESTATDKPTPFLVCLGGDEFTPRDMRVIMKKIKRHCTKYNLEPVLPCPEEEKTNRDFDDPPSSSPELEIPPCASVASPKNKSHIDIVSSAKKRLKHTETAHNNYALSQHISNTNVTNHVEDYTDDNSGSVVGLLKCGTTLVNPCKKVDTSRYVAMDCEFVGVGPRKLSALGRCSIIDYHGDVICDIYAKPKTTITDFRTRWSGLRKKDMVHAIHFGAAQRKIKEILQGKVVIGHALQNDFSVLCLKHPVADIRDTCSYPPLFVKAKLPAGKGKSLKNLTFYLTGKTIQKREHCSIEDSRAALELFKLVEEQWEEDASMGRYLQKHKPPPKRKWMPTNMDKSDPQAKRRKFDNEMDVSSQDGLIINVTYGNRNSRVSLEETRTRTYSIDYMGDEFWPADLTT